MLPLLILLLTLSSTPGQSFPSYSYDDDDGDADLAAFDYYRATEELEQRNASACEQCVTELCPPTRGCRAGLVRDSCGCCSECGNLEGQPCDPGERNLHYGLCGVGLECKTDGDTVCACVSQEPVCGSDGHTYMNLCKFQEAAFTTPGLEPSDGPCRTGTGTC